MIIEKGQIFDDVNNLPPTKYQLEAFLLFRTVAGLTASNIGNSGLRFFTSVEQWNIFVVVMEQLVVVTSHAVVSYQIDY